MDTHVKEETVKNAKIKRIAWLHSHFLLWAGGTKFVYEVSRRMHQKIPVDMIVERCSPEMNERYRREGMSVIEINNRSSTSHWYWLFFPFYLEKDIRRLQELKSRYSFFITSMFPMNYVVYRATAYPYMSYVMEPFAFFHDRDMIHGFPMFDRILLSVLAQCYKNLDIEGVQKATVVMTINRGTADWAREIYCRDAIPSYLGVDTDFFAPKPNPALIRKYEGKKIIIHSTDFTPLKKTWDAVQIIEVIKNKIPNLKLLITWSFENARELARLKRYVQDHDLNDHIEFVGHVSHNDLPYYYSLADVSLYTGIGRGASAASLFVLECMACGTPGVRTDFTADEIVHELTGFLYRAGDTRSLEKYLTELLTNDPLRKKFGEEARKQVLLRYNWDRVVDRILEILEKAKQSDGRA
ncbi:MAG: glycosyltransferase family 4 protein [Candidatus Omnitrophica bacterium]|nr:glycosyltransferase family 4 protein [Candidatus Omnitrophota bacterium]